MTTGTKSPTLALLIVVILLGAGLRLYQLVDAPIRGDEVFTIRYWMRQPLADTLANNIVEDPHPPLIIGLYRGWSLLLGGDSQIARFLPALANAAGIAGLYAVGKRLAGWRVGLLASLMWALHPFEVWHAQDARSYGVWATANVLTVWLGVRALTLSRRRDWGLYIVAATAGAYIYYLELFTLAALTLWLLVAFPRDRRRLGGWLAANALVGLLLAFWYLQPRLLAGGGYGGTTGGLNIGLFGTWFVPTLTFGETLSHGLGAEPVAGLWPLLLFPPVLGAALWWRRHPASAALPVLLVLVPALLLALISLRLNVFTPRYIMSVIPGLLLLVAYGCEQLWRGDSMRRLAGGVITVSWLATSVFSLQVYFFDYAKTPPWPALVDYLAANAHPGDLIVQAAADEAFNFYLDELAQPFDRKQLPANPRQPAAEITALLEADLRTHERMWRVAQTFTDWPSYGIAETWFEANMQLVVDTTVSGLRVQQWRRWDVDRAALPDAAMAEFADVARLRAAEVLQNNGDQREVVVVLYWEPTSTTPSPLTGTVQLLGAVNPATSTSLWSQADHAPQMGRAQTTDWTPGEVYRDVYTLDLSGVPAGEYALVARLYDPSTGERIPVADGDGFEVAPVDIE